MTDPEIVWEEPPKRSTVSVFSSQLEEVQSRPGDWARLRVYETQSAAYGARKRLTKSRGEEDAHWEFRVGKIALDGYGLFARYRTEEQLKGG